MQDREAMARGEIPFVVVLPHAVSGADFGVTYASVSRVGGNTAIASHVGEHETLRPVKDFGTARRHSTMRLGWGLHVAFPTLSLTSLHVLTWRV